MENDSQKLYISLSREHSNNLQEIADIFADTELDVEINADFVRLSDSDLPMQLVIALGEFVFNGATWDLMKLAIQKIYQKFPKSTISIKHSSATFTVKKDLSIVTIVIPEKKEEFEHIQKFEDLGEHLSSNENNIMKHDLKLSKHDFYFETPLYELIKYDKFENAGDLFRGDVDGYSSKNDTDTTYEVNFDWITQIDHKYINSYKTEYTGFAIVTLKCKRKDNDKLTFFIFNSEIDGLTVKVGQYPSIAKLQFSNLERKYTKVLEKKYLKQFKKAIECASHGYGVASFVYLRRIFENLILQTFNKNNEQLEKTEEEFMYLKMENKIELLKNLLPSQLLEMKSIYGILSVGVHKLEEDVCLKYFHPLKLSIELILDQKIEEDLKNKRDEEVKQQIQQITKELSG